MRRGFNLIESTLFIIIVTLREIDTEADTGVLSI